jgi:hypothetical protein
MKGEYGDDVEHQQIRQRRRLNLRNQGSVWVLGLLRRDPARVHKQAVEVLQFQWDAQNKNWLCCRSRGCARAVAWLRTAGSFDG